MILGKLIGVFFVLLGWVVLFCVSFVVDMCVVGCIFCIWFGGLLNGLYFFMILDVNVLFLVLIDFLRNLIEILKFWLNIMMSELLILMYSFYSDDLDEVFDFIEKIYVDNCFCV